MLFVRCGHDQTRSVKKDICHSKVFLDLNKNDMASHFSLFSLSVSVFVIAKMFNYVYMYISYKLWTLVYITFSHTLSFFSCHICEIINKWLNQKNDVFQYEII